MKKNFIFTWIAMNGTILNPAISPKIKIWTAAITINFIVKHQFCELINAEYFMKTLKITSMFVSRMTVATNLLKMCLSNIFIDDEILSVEKRSRSPCLYVNISLATVTSSKHSEHLGQSLDQASDVCRRSYMLKKLTCIAGSSYSSAALYDIIP